MKMDCVNIRVICFRFLIERTHGEGVEVGRCVNTHNIKNEIKTVSKAMILVAAVFVNPNSFELFSAL